MKSLVQKGDYVIVNEADKPCAKLIAKVSETNYAKKRLKVTYICEAVDYPRNFEIDLVRATKVEDFGVEIKIDQLPDVRGIEKKDTIFVTKVRKSIARYPDGTIREWQPNFDEERGLKIKEEFRK